MILQILGSRERYALLNLLQLRLQNAEEFVVVLIQLSMQCVELALLLPAESRNLACYLFLREGNLRLRLYEPHYRAKLFVLFKVDYRLTREKSKEQVLTAS